MTIVSPMGQLRPVFADKNGKRLSGGKVFTYEPGTLTPKATYADALNLIPNTNPIDLDKYGEADIFLNGDYRIRVVDRHGVLIDDYDNLMAWATKRYLDSALSGFASGANNFYPTLADANADIANIAVNQVVNIGELENGGLWYKESTESTTLTKTPYDAFELSKQYSNQKQVVQEQYINDLFAAQTQNIENLINQQGVSLQQLDVYYNYLMRRLAQIAVDKGWEASFVVSADGSTQQQVNDRGGSGWYEKPLGYAVNERVVLSNGDIVRSTVASNTVNPNVDMTGWVKTNLASQIFDLMNNSQQEINDQIKTPFVLGAVGDGVTDDTAALNLLNDPQGKYVIQMTKGDYLTDGIVIPPNSIVYFNGSTVRRRRYTGKPVIDVPPSSVIVSVIEDGNKDTLGSVGGAIGDYGIRLQEGAIAIFCTQKNNYSHGLTQRGTSTLAPTSNQQALYCVSVNNGFNAGPFGTADGFNALNCNNGSFIGCRSYGSARTGFVSETYNGNIAGDDKHDITFSNGFKFKDCFAEGSGYNDFNAEMTTNPIFDDIKGEQVTFRGSLRTQITKANVGQIYGQGADFTQLSESNIVTTTRSNDVLYLTGKSPKVSNVGIVVGDSAVLSGTVATVQDSTGYNGEVIGLSVNRAFNGMNLRVANAVALRVDSATNVKYFIGRAEGSANVTNFKQLIDKKLEVFASSVPTQGAWNRGDIVWNTFFSSTAKTMAWICTTSGVFGVTPPIFEAVTIMSRAVAVPNAAGANPTKAEFDALLTALRNGGQLSP